MGIDDKAWRAIESLARELNEKSPEAVARKAIVRAKAVGVRVLDGLVSRLAGRRVDTAPRRMIEAGDGAWVARAISGAAPLGSSRADPRAWTGEGERGTERLDVVAEASRADGVVADGSPAPGVVVEVAETAWTGEAPAPTSPDVEGRDDSPGSTSQVAETYADSPGSTSQSAETHDDSPGSTAQNAETHDDSTGSTSHNVETHDDSTGSTSHNVETHDDSPGSTSQSVETHADSPGSTSQDIAPNAAGPARTSQPPTDAPPDLVIPSATAPLPSLPPRYGIDRVVLLAGESEWVFVYWETDPVRVAGATRAELRLLSEEGALVGRAYVDPVQGRQHLRVPARGRRYHAELVHLDGTLLSRSRDVVVRASEVT